MQWRTRSTVMLPWRSYFTFLFFVTGSHMKSIIQSQSVCQSDATELFYVQMSIIMIYTFQLHSADVSKLVILRNRMSRVESENNVTNRPPCVCKYSQCFYKLWRTCDICEIYSIKFSICKISFYLWGLKNVCAQVCAYFYSSLTVSNAALAFNIKDVSLYDVSIKS